MEGRSETDRWIALGEDLLDREQFQAALDPLRRALTVDPDLPRAHALLALVLLGLKRLSAALVEARMALVLDPEAALSHLVLGHVLLAHRKPDEARGHFDTARVFDPSNPAPLRGLAAIERHFDREARAIEILDEALGLAPEDVETIVSLGRAHLASGHIDEAARRAREALEIEPEHTGALVLMGFVLLRRGDVQDAREHAIWALRTGASEHDALELLVAIKAHESLWLGLWFRLNSMLAALGPKAMLVLIGAFVVQRFLRLALEDLKFGGAASVVEFAWLGLCVYSWVAPGIFRRMIEREIEMVKLRDGF